MNLSDIRRLSLTALVIAAAACGGGQRETLVVERDTVGDTIVVRTVAGSEWGAPRTLTPEMTIGAFEGEDEYVLGDVAGFAVAPDGSVFLYDRQVPALRKYGPDGTYIATFGREGAGPGEYRRSDGGVAVLPDGRVLLRDPGNGRINVYSSGGEPLGHWEARAGHYTSRPLYVDTAGRAYTQIWGRNAAGERYGGLQRYGPEGARLDSLLAPTWGYQAPSISASGERFSMTNPVPFSPTEQWTLTPAGAVVAGLSTRYAVDTYRPDGTVLRFERVIEPVPVHPDEKANAEARAVHNFRRMVPDWKWNGPAIPDHKPPFRGLYAGRDGRVYVQLWTAGEPVAAEEIEVPDDPNAEPPDRWREPVVFDVFEPDGVYLGQIRAPERFRTGPQPVFDGDRIWAVVTDELDVEYLARFRVVDGESEGGRE